MQRDPLDGKKEVVVGLQDIPKARWALVSCQRQGDFSTVTHTLRFLRNAISANEVALRGANSKEELVSSVRRSVHTLHCSRRRHVVNPLGRDDVYDLTT